MAMLPFHTTFRIAGGRASSEALAAIRSRTSAELFGRQLRVASP